MSADTIAILTPRRVEIVECRTISGANPGAVFFTVSAVQRDGQEYGDVADTLQEARLVAAGLAASGHLPIKEYVSRRSVLADAAGNDNDGGAR